MADYVEKGTALEAGLKAGVASVLPQGIKDAIPATLRDSLLGRDTGRGSGDAPASRAEPAAAEKPQSFANNLLQRQQPAPATAPSSNGASAPGLATWTITTDEEDGVARPLSPGADVSGAGDAPPAILAELAEVLQGVGALKSTLLALRTNGDPALGTMSRLNVREAEVGLRGCCAGEGGDCMGCRVPQWAKSPGTGDVLPHCLLHCGTGVLMSLRPGSQRTIEYTSPHPPPLSTCAAGIDTSAPPPFLRRRCGGGCSS